MLKEIKTDSNIIDKKKKKSSNCSLHECVCVCVDPQDKGLLRGGGVCWRREGRSWLPPVARAGSCCPGVSDGAEVGGGGGDEG